MGHDSVPSQSVDYTHAHGLPRRQPAAQCANNNRKYERLNRNDGGYMKIKRKGWRRNGAAIELGRESVDRQGENHSDDAGSERQR